MSESRDMLANLNKQQHQAVSAGSGPVLVLAGPGSGKTRVLTRRIGYLISQEHVPAYRILAVTFTNKAAREMGERVRKMLGEEDTRDFDEMWLGTFHAMCARLLRREAAVLPFTSSFVIMDADDQETLVKRAIREFKIDEKLYKPASVHASISNAKNELILPEEYPIQTYRDEVVKRVYERYQKLLLDNNAVDFDDLLVWAVRLLVDNPAVLEKYSHRFLHVLVDEFQDTNKAQYELLKLLASHHRNLFVVGDEDQSIYRWRGADYRNVRRFEQDFPDCQKILLEQNYRSTQTVLDAARSVIDQNRNRTPKHLTAARQTSGERILLHEAVDDHAEAAFVVDTIEQLLDSGKASGGDFAIMYRTNAQSRLLEEAFLRAGMGYRLVGAQRFYGRREVKDMIAYLRLVQNPADEISLLRVINTPARGIGDKTVVALQLAAQQAGVTAGEVLLSLGERVEHSPYWEAFKGRGAVLLADFGGMLLNWVDVREKLPLPALFDRILVDTDYQHYLEDNSEEGIDRWENVQELRRLAYEYNERGLVEFLETLALVADQDTLPEEVNVPTLLTLHAAKGLEFPQVFIIGLDEGILPHSRSRDDPEEMAEERRLFYVGLTRAKDRLYLVRAQRRSTFGSYEDTIPSQFLKAIPNELIQGRRSPSFTRSAPRWGRRGLDEDEQPTTTGVRSASFPPARPAPARQTTYSAGMRVRHASWGDGMVLNSRLDAEGEETVDVVFESVGIKRLLASLAKLEILPGK